MALRHARPSLRWAALALAIVVVLAVAIGGWRARSVSTAPTPLLAVLPFSTESQQHVGLANGLHAGLLVRLGQLKAFRTISRTSMLEYADTTKSIDAVADELGADFVLEGSVMVIRDRLHMTVQLFGVAAKNRPLWGEVYERQLTAEDLLHVQASLTKTIAKQLRVELSQAERSGVEEVLTGNTLAYNAYLHGLELWNNDGSDLEAQAAAFRKAVEFDPDFAEAWAYLSVSLLAQTTLPERDVPDRQQLLRKAWGALRKARVGKPNAPEVHYAWSIYLELGAGELRRALGVLEALEKRVPLSADALSHKASILSALGRYAEAQETFADAVALMPRSVRIAVARTAVAILDRRCDGAAEYLEVARALGPEAPLVLQVTIDYELNCMGRYERVEGLLEGRDLTQHRYWKDLAEALERQGKFERALAVRSRAASKLPSNLQFGNTAHRIVLLRLLGREAEAQVLLDRLVEQLPLEPSLANPYRRAVVHSLRGRSGRDAALAQDHSRAGAHERRPQDTGDRGLRHGGAPGSGRVARPGPRRAAVGVGPQGWRGFSASREPPRAAGGQEAREIQGVGT